MSDLPSSPPNDPKESESRYRTLFENSPVSIWEEDFSEVKIFFDQLRHEGVTDIEAYFDQHSETVRQCADLAKIIDVNRASLVLHGAASKEELLAGLVNTFTPESFDTFREELACLWHGETELQRDAVVKTLAGEPRNVTVYFTVCPGYEETLGRVFVSLIDITERKQGAEALVIRERQYRTLAGSLPDNIIGYDREGRVTYLNPALEKNLGIHASDRIGKRVREFHTDGSYEAYAQAIDTVLATGEKIEFEFIQPKSDPPRIHAIRMVAEHNERGEITGALAISYDITELKQKEKELLASEQQFRSLAENSPDNIVRYDHQCRLIYYNPMMAQSMPFDAEMALGKTPLEHGFGGPEVSAEYEKHIRHVLQSGESSDMELTVPYAQGELRHNLVRFTAEYDTQGEISGVLAIGRDITALKHAEQERQLHTDFLAKLDRINRVIQGAEDIETMMGNVLDEVLNIFECDRVYLLYPCDPSAESFSIPMERTRPEFPGAGTSSTITPIDAEISNTQELLLHSSGALQFGPGTTHPVPASASERYGFKSFMAIALSPKTGKAWEFGIQQCSYARVWPHDEEVQFQEIARRLSDGLTSMLILRDLQESEKKYRRLFDTSREGIWGQDENFVTSFVNTHMADMLGFTADELHGRTVTDFMFEEDIADHQQKIKRLKQQIAEVYERRFRRKDGSTLWTLLSASPVFDDSGRFNGSFAMVTDITALKQTELQLKHALTVTESIINAMPDILFEVDENGVYLNVWTRNPERLAAPKEELLGRRADEILPPEAAAKAMAAIREADEKGISLENIIRLDLPDGSHWFEHSLSKIPSDDPAAAPHFLVLSRDVTERMRVEEALRASERRFHAIFNQSFQFIGLMSTDGTLLEANHAATEFTGIDRSEVLGKPFWEGPWWSHSTELQQQVRDAVRDAAGGQFVRMEVTHPDVEGNLHYVDFSLMPVTDTDGKVIQLIPEGRDITERKLTEEALRHEQTLLNRIMVTSPVGIAMVNREGQIIFANPQAEIILGLSKEAITQRSYNAPEWHATTIDGEPLPDEAQPFSRVMAAREPVFDVQHAITWPNGRRVLLSVNGAPIFDAQNEVEAVAFAIEDITERKQVEKELLDARLLFEGVVEQSPVPMALAKPTGELIFNKACADFLHTWDEPTLVPGVKLQDMKQPWKDYDAQGNPLNTMDLPLAKALRGEVTTNLELQVVRKDGSRKWEMATSTPIYDNEGNLIAGFVTFPDITERKQAEEKLQRSEHGLSEAQRIAHLGNWELDLINDSLIWSDEIFNIFEIDKEAFGASYEAFLDAIHPEDRERVNHAYTESLTEKKPYNIVHRLLMKDGRIKYVNEQCESFFDTDGKPIRSVGTVQDITEQKLREDELSRYRDHLEDEVHQRTEELRLARDAAEAANKAKSTFLANMSHELRTPLNAILGFSQMMRQASNLDEMQQKNLEIINNSGKHLLKLINDVLEIAKIEAGKLQLEIAPFDLHELVREVSDMMRLRAQQKGLQLELDQSSEFPRYIKGDEARLRQILVNLLSNAVKFTEQGGVTIRLRTKNNRHHHLIIEVEDTGPGISETNQKRLFKPFVQLPEGKMQEGTGLGLAIVRQFVKLIQGDISVDSKPGRGSLFRVDIPLMEADTTEVIQLSGERHGEVIGLVPGQPSYRILIAEDQQDNQILLTRLMTDLGLEVKVAENGKECVALFKKWKPDLIWMDRRMPVMDGVKATRQIRKLPGGEKVKIVAVTASAFREQQAELLKEGMDDFVGKPYRFDEIYTSLERQLGLKLLYNNESPEQESPALTLESEMLDDVSDELRAALKEALKTLNAERITETIQRIGEKDHTLECVLMRLADNYDYPTILNALNEVER